MRAVGSGEGASGSQNRPSVNVREAANASYERTPERTPAALASVSDDSRHTDRSADTLSACCDPLPVLRETSNRFSGVLVAGLLAASGAGEG